MGRRADRAGWEIPIAYREEQMISPRPCNGERELLAELECLRDALRALGLKDVDPYRGVRSWAKREVGVGILCQEE